MYHIEMYGYRSKVAVTCDGVWERPLCVVHPDPCHPFDIGAVKRRLECI